MQFERASGILLHPTSLPGRFGIGDLGSIAFVFCDHLSEAGQAYWQILPLGPTGYGDSPYQCFSAFAGNPLLISPEKLVDDGLIEQQVLEEAPEFPEHTIDYAAVQAWKSQLLLSAYDGFNRVVRVDLRDKFESFVQANEDWLDTYALYRAIKHSHGEKPWYEWPDDLKLRDAAAVAKAAQDLYEPVQAEKFAQFLFFRQWAELRNYANSRGIKMIGDIPIFVALDSADVWRHQELFKLRSDGSPEVVAGVPPDYFSRTGQLWGNPIYDWEAMAADRFSWWTRRVTSTLGLVDIVRIDHFRGFTASWEVPGEDETAENGRWVDVPGKELFSALARELGELPIIAEDLGVITPEVEDLRDGFGFPGMRILQFAFGGDANNHDLPHSYIRNCVAYTGTHDNDTTVGWFKSQAGSGSTRDEEDISREHDYCLKYLDSDGTEIHWDFIRAVWASVADTAIAPAQDLLGIGTEGRMNLPATMGGNWQWRLVESSLTPEIIARLKDLTQTYGRSRRAADQAPARTSKVNAGKEFVRLA